MASKYSEEELNDLYQLALEQGWDQLEPSERMSLGRWCRKNNKPRPGIEPDRPETAASAEEKPRIRPTSPPETPGEYFRAIGLAPSSSAAAADRAREDVSLLREARFIETWPDDIAVGSHTTTRWDRIALALRTFADHLAVVRDDCTRKVALDIRRRIRLGVIRAFLPAGSYRCEISPDRAHAGKWQVIAQYTGKATK